MTNQKFTINPEYLCDVPIKYGFTTDNGAECGITASVDHPAFAELRTHLEHRGFIKTERTWHNGDRVLKPFYFNDRLFEVGEKFPCAAAQGVQYRITSRKTKETYDCPMCGNTYESEE